MAGALELNFGTKARDNWTANITTSKVRINEFIDAFLIISVRRTRERSRFSVESKRLYILRHVKTYRLHLCQLQRYGLDLLGGLKEVLRRLCLIPHSLIINFCPRVSLGAHLAPTTLAKQ